jgi:hypothetical protein
MSPSVQTANQTALLPYLVQAHLALTQGNLALLGLPQVAQLSPALLVQAHLALTQANLAFLQLSQAPQPPATPVQPVPPVSPLPVSPPPATPPQPSPAPAPLSAVQQAEARLQALNPVSNQTVTLQLAGRRP